jgi:hypothetical protein
VGQEIVGFIGGNDMGVSRVNQGKGAASRTDIHRLPKAIKH